MKQLGDILQKQVQQMREIMNMKYRKKPVVIEAIQFTCENIDKLRKFAGESVGELRMPTYPGERPEIEVFTLEDGSDGRAKHVATDGDWIIKGISGEFYPCKPDIFEATYEPYKDKK